MIKINGRNFEWEEGLTVKKLLEKKNYTYPSIVVRINGKYIPPGEYNEAMIKDNDHVEAIHLISGG